MTAKLDIKKFSKHYSMGTLRRDLLELIESNPDNMIVEYLKAHGISVGAHYLEPDGEGGFNIGMRVDYEGE